MVSDIRLRVAGTGSYLPERSVRNEDFEGKTVFYYDSSGKRVKEKLLDANGIFEVTGIRSRRYAAPDERAETMAYIAADRALTNAGVSAESLEGIFFASVSERDYPGGAAYLLNRFGLRNRFAANVPMACCSFIEAASAARHRAVHHPGNYLVVAADVMSRMADPTDINSTLFGDGAGAVVFVPSSDERGIVADYSSCDPSDKNLGYIFRDDSRFVRMPDGNAVLKRAVHAMVDAAREVKRRAGWDHADVYFPHQANERIVAGVEGRLQDSGAVVYRTVSEYGNMAGATCPVALDEARRNDAVRFSSEGTKGSRIVLVSFASGLLTSAMAVQL